MSVDKILMTSPGTPYDWENPETYRPPAYLTEHQIQENFALAFHSMAEHVGYVERTEPQPPRKKSKVWPGVKTAAKVLFWGGVVVPMGVTSIVDTLTRPPEYDCPDIPGQPPVDEAGNLSEARNKVANMNFGIEKETYTALKERLDNAQSVEEVEEITKEAMSPFGINVIYADVPKRKIGILPPVADPLKSHSPELLTTEEAKESTDKFLINLSRIPSSFLQRLEGYNLFFTHDPRNPFERGMGGYFEQGTLLSSANIVLDTSFPDEIGTSFNHEVMHPKHREQCGNSLADNADQGGGDADFTAKNPPEFFYTADEKLSLDAREKNITISRYAASHYREDVAETGESLLSGGYTYDRQGNGREITAHKKHVIAQRLSLIEPNFEYYVAYLGYVGNIAFPKELAKQESLVAECFHYDPTNNGMSGSVEPINMFVYDYADWSDDLPMGEYKFLKIPNPNTANPAAPNVYRAAWLTPNLTETDQHIRKQIGWSLLEQLRAAGEAPMYMVEFTYTEQPSKHYGPTQVTCTTFEQLTA